MTEPHAAGGNADQIEYWNSRAGATWTNLQERLDRLFVDVTALALEKAAPLAGERILDVGCGCGDTTLTLARLAGPQGKVFGVDVSEPMVARARQRIATSNLDNVEITVADAAVTPLEGTEADLLFSRFGVMFFDDPVAAFGNLRKAMRPGGRMVCVAWRGLMDNPWFRIPWETALPLLPPQPLPVPNSPGPFAFADATYTREVLRQAGWDNPQTEPMPIPLILSPLDDLDSAVDLVTRVGPLARPMTELNPEVRSRVCDTLAGEISRWQVPEGYRLFGWIWLIYAKA